MSNIVCALSGAGGTILLFSLQAPLSYISSKIHKTFPKHRILKIIYEDCIHTIVLVCVVLLWRGCINLNYRYMISDPLLGGVVNMCGGLVVLLALRTYRVLTSFSWGMDGEDTGVDPFFPTYYTYIYTDMNSDGNTQQSSLRSRTSQDGILP